MPFLSRLAVTPVGDERWELIEPLVYRGEVDVWEVPAGYQTDYASAPRIVAWLVPRAGRYTRAAIVHDYLITDVWPAGGISPVDVDGVFRRIMRELEVSVPRRWAMWAGVRWGSLLGGRHAGWWRTAPAVLGVSVLALVPVAVGAAGSAVGMAIVGVVEAAFRHRG